MRSTWPLLKETSATPPAAGVGLAIAPPTRCARDSAWIHGRLTVAAAGREERLAWLRSLFVTVVSEAWQVPIVASLARNSAPLADPAWTEASPGAASLAFSIDLAATVAPEALQPDALYVHLSAREHASAVVVVPADRALEPVAPRVAADLLLQARALRRDGLEAEAAAVFARALADAAIAADVDGAWLHEAACAASLASASAPAAERASLIASATRWLEQDRVARAELGDVAPREPDADLAPLRAALDPPRG
jgi:hypothetical protein